MVTPTGFEPVTCPLGGGCSIQLSHGAAKIRYLQYFFLRAFCLSIVCQLSPVDNRKYHSLPETETASTWPKLSKFQNVINHCSETAQFTGNCACAHA